MCAYTYMFSQSISSIRCLGGRQFLCGRGVTSSVPPVQPLHGSQSTIGIGTSLSRWGTVSASKLLEISFAVLGQGSSYMINMGLACTGPKTFVIMPLRHLSVALGRRSRIITSLLMVNDLGWWSPTRFSIVCSRRWGVQGWIKDKRVLGARLKSNSAGVLEVVLWQIFQYEDRKWAI